VLAFGCLAAYVETSAGCLRWIERIGQSGLWRTAVRHEPSRRWNPVGRAPRLARSIRPTASRV